MIVLRSKDEIGQIRKAGSILALTLEKLKRHVKPGVETKELDEIARDEIIKRNGYPAFKGYNGFPGNICVSVNECVVHGIPSDRKLRDGDIVSLDVGVKFRDYCADGAITVGVGKINDAAVKLLEVTEKALYIGIEKARAGKRLTDLSHAIQEYVESNSFGVVRSLVGHGIGTKIHEDPEIPNFGKPGMGPVLEPGMILAIEPMVNAGTYEVETLDDGWSVVTKDRRLSAHFEHTIAVTAEGPQILTAK
ncbi:MAG: type I methionyl aminopeptidase [Candidatus Omnitrophica bacterium]|nr:type I methionyl aminopeptidase [Candidatus Omnitrophota bacterium]